jgi:long-chain acyl-CoA synthetase
LFGEGRPWNTAVIVPRMKDGQVAQIEEIEQAVTHVNAGLPDYARIGMWVFAETPFTVDNGQLTPNGRLRRAQIWQRHAPKIVSLYEESINAVL